VTHARLDLDAAMTLSELPGWVLRHGAALVAGGLILFVAYRVVASLIPRVVDALLGVQQATMPGAEPIEEVRKRKLTLEVVLTKLARAGFVIAIVLLVLGVFDLFGVLAGLGLFAAALTLAGQAIVLDYLMGILILIEGPFFKGDWIAINSAGVNVEGEVQEIGLRRTVLRDTLGSLHSVSNGLIRVSSNTTRVYAIAAAEAQIVRPADIDRAIAVAGRVARELGEERGWTGQLYESPIDTWVTALTENGATIQVHRRVPPSARLEATSELRRRLYAGLAAESIGTESPEASPPGEASGS
jgi:small-conductance mechanosensitive channel